MLDLLPASLNVGQILAILVCVNIALSAAKQILVAVHVSLPAWLQPVSSFLQKAVDFLSANVQH